MSIWCSRQEVSFFPRGSVVTHERLGQVIELSGYTMEEG